MSAFPSPCLHIHLSIYFSLVLSYLFLFINLSTSISLFLHPSSYPSLSTVHTLFSSVPINMFFSPYFPLPILLYLPLFLTLISSPALRLLPSPSTSPPSPTFLPPSLLSSSTSLLFHYLLLALSPLLSHCRLLVSPPRPMPIKFPYVFLPFIRLRAHSWPHLRSSLLPKA